MKTTVREIEVHTVDEGHGVLKVYVKGLDLSIAEALVHRAVVRAINREEHEESDGT